MANQNDGNGSKREKHVITPVANGKTPEKSKMQKAIGIFLAEDASDIKDHIVDEYIAPRAKSFGLELVRKLKEFILDNIVDIARTMLFGDSKKGTSSKGYDTGYYEGNRVYYTSYYNSTNSSYEGTPYKYTAYDNATRPVTSLEPLDLTYLEAERVRGELIGLSKKYPFVPIADYYQLCKRPDLCRSIENDFGWISFEGGIEIVKGSKPMTYQLALPKPVPLP